MKTKTNIPILVYNKQWEPPENLIKQVHAERMITNLIELSNPNILTIEEKIGYAEVICYMQSLTMSYPIKNTLANVYLYCCKKTFEKYLNKELFKDLDFPNELSSDELNELNNLKRFIYKNRGKDTSHPIIEAFKEVFENETDKKRL